MDNYIQMYEPDVGPLNGAKVVAKAWTDPDYKARLLADGTAAIAELGFKGPQGEHIVVVENTPAVHNVVVCTLCSCYPWPVLGLPPTWYKDPAYRSRMVREPRAVLRELGLDLEAEVEVRVWDSSSEVRYMVLPERPPGTEDLSEEELAALVTRDAMVGVAEVGGRAVSGHAHACSTSTVPPPRPAATASLSSPSRGRAGRSAWRSRSTTPASSIGRTSAGADRADPRGRPSGEGDCSYYQCWLLALEDVLVARPWSPPARWSSGRRTWPHGRRAADHDDHEGHDHAHEHAH